MIRAKWRCFVSPPMADLPPAPFTPEALATRWGCSPDQIRALCRKGRLFVQRRKAA